MYDCGSVQHDIDKGVFSIDCLYRKKTTEAVKEAVDLLNDNEYDEALQVFRRHFGLVNRFVCELCGNAQASLVLQNGCNKCGSQAIHGRVIIEKPLF